MSETEARSANGEAYTEEHRRLSRPDCSYPGTGHALCSNGVTSQQNSCLKPVTLATAFQPIEDFDGSKHTLQKLARPEHCAEWSPMTVPALRSSQARHVLWPLRPGQGAVPRIMVNRLGMGKEKNCDFSLYPETMQRHTFVYSSYSTSGRRDSRW